MHSEGNVNVWNDKVLRCSYLGLKVSHRLIKSLWRRPLVVTQNSDCSVSPVVGQQFLCHTVRLFRGWYNSHLYLNRKIMLRTHVTRLMHRHLKDKSFLCSSCHSHTVLTHTLWPHDNQQICSQLAIHRWEVWHFYLWMETVAEAAVNRTQIRAKQHWVKW